MRIGLSDGQLVALHVPTGQWLPIGGPWNDDLLAFLAGGAAARRQAASIVSRNPTPTTPPRDLPLHYRRIRTTTTPIDPGGAQRTLSIRAARRERAARRAGNAAAWHTANNVPAMANDAHIRRPAEAHELIVTLHLDATFAWPFADGDPDEAVRAISGFVVVAEFTALLLPGRSRLPSRLKRPTPDGARLLGVVLSPVVATPDEVLDRWPKLVGSVRRDGHLLDQGQLNHSAQTLGEVLGAGSDQTLGYGDLASTAHLQPVALPSTGSAREGVALAIDGVATVSVTVEAAV